MPIPPASPSRQSAITIGAFDGVHLGHQHLFTTLVAHARKHGLQAVVITFWPLPAVYFGRADGRYALTFPEERAQLIKNCGVDRVITLEFNQHLAGLSAAEFLQVVQDHTHFVWLAAGSNFALGKDRLGNIDALQALGAQMNFELEVVAPKLDGPNLISSSQIRQDLAEGRIRQANQKLGRHFMLPGKVVHGENRGSRLGFPTANLQIAAERLLPGNGVYVTRAWMNESDAMAVTNIGVRPTFENPLPQPRVEPHLLDTEQDLYDSEMTLEFIDFVRPEKKFANAAQLTRQIKKDIQYTRKVFLRED